MVTTDGLAFDPMPLKQGFMVWGRSYQKLADLVGCTRPTAHNVVNGKSPTSKYLRPIAGVLNIDITNCWKIEEAAS